MTKTFASMAFAGLALLMLPATTALAATEPSYNLAAIYDADNDNRVSQTEIDTKRTEMHAKFDADKSGSLSQAEFDELWKSIHATLLGEEFKEFDKNGNGSLELSEWVDPMKQIVAQNDKSGDGFLSREDLRKEVSPMPELLKP